MEKTLFLSYRNQMLKDLPGRSYLCRFSFIIFSLKQPRKQMRNSYSFLQSLPCLLGHSHIIFLELFSLGLSVLVTKCQNIFSGFNYLYLGGILKNYGQQLEIDLNHEELRKLSWSRWMGQLCNNSAAI